VGKAASEYLVEGIYMTKAILDGEATQVIDLAKSISSADGGEVGSKDMMGASYCCLIQPGFCLKAFHLIAEDGSCSLKARDVRTW
jgi:hypothetical protein